MKVYGRNVLNEIIASNKSIRKIYISKTFRDKDVLNVITDHDYSYEFVDGRALDRMVDGNHQGIVIEIDDYEYEDVTSFYRENIIVILDHLEDPHNFGAIIRTCEAAGIKSIIIPKDRSVQVNSTVMKTSAGALEHIRIARVNNLVNEIKELKKQGFFIYAAEADGQNYKEVDFAHKIVLVIGSEGNGVSRLVRENSDVIVSLPMHGKVNSLNASVAAGIFIYHLIS